MNPLLVLVMALAAAAGPLADIWWVEWVEEALEQSPGEAAGLMHGRLRAELSRSVSGVRWRTSGAMTVRVGAFNVNFAGAGSRPIHPNGSIDRSAAVTVKAPGMELGIGRLRGGLGSGLLVRTTSPWGDVGAWSGPWTGRPTGLRAHPGSAPDVEATGTYLSGSRRPWTLAHVRTRDGSGWWLASIVPMRNLEAVVMVGESAAGLEADGALALGRAAMGIAAASWLLDGEEGGAVEFRFAAGKGDRFGLRAWRVWGPPPPLAPLPRGAGERWRSGLSFGMKLRPASGWLILSELERRYGSAATLGGSRWERRFDISRSGTDGISMRLRLIERYEEEYRQWGGCDSRGVVREALSVHIPAGMAGALGAGLQHSSERAGRGTAGVWLQLDRPTGLPHAYVRLARIFRADGSAVWWSEPTPSGTWGVRADRRLATRIVLGASGAGGRFHIRIALQHGDDPELMVVWQSR